MSEEKSVDVRALSRITFETRDKDAIDATEGYPFCLEKVYSRVLIGCLQRIVDAAEAQERALHRLGRDVAALRRALVEKPRTKKRKARNL